MVTLHYKKKKMVLPESFEELSGKQFIAIAGLLYHGGDLLRCHLKALRILSNTSRFRFRFMESDLVDRAKEQINWVFDPELYRKVTKQLVESYKGYYGPVSDFDNLKMGEFHWSEMYYREHLTPALSIPIAIGREGEEGPSATLRDDNDNDEEALNKLIAVLYREPKWSYDKKINPEGDVREKFNAQVIEYNARTIARWPSPVKHAVFLWYDACRQKLIEDNPLVFEDPVRGFESEFDTGLYGMMRSLAGDKLGSVEKIEDMYVHTAMLEIGLIKEEEKMLEQDTPASP